MLPVSFDALETPDVLANAADVSVTVTAADVFHPSAAAVPEAALMLESNATSSAADTTDATPMSEVKKRKYSSMFDGLPSDDMDCSAVDVNHGKWYKCNKCEKKLWPELIKIENLLLAVGKNTRSQ